MTKEVAKPCAGGCGKEASKLACPTCLKMDQQSYFCGQECFKKNWAKHKILHDKSAQDTNSLAAKIQSMMRLKPEPTQILDAEKGTYNPYPDFNFSGPLRPYYPLSPKRTVPDSITKPDYAEDGQPKSEQRIFRSTKITILNEQEIEGMRKVCRLAREVLDIAAAAVRPGITTDEIDEIVHKECIKRDSYPSPLNYYYFPKSVCTSVNEVICHGIPDKRPLQDGDIVNLDVTLYHGGFHGDLNETYYVGDKSKANPDIVRLVETSRECLDQAIKLVKPGMLFRDVGAPIEKFAKENDCSVVRTYCGHGINKLFHPPPSIPHYAKNKAVGVARPGMTFTIEPMINLGKSKDMSWPDNWTAVTADGLLSAQFEHTLLVTEDGVEVLTARTEKSPGGAIPRI